MFKELKGNNGSEQSFTVVANQFSEFVELARGEVDDGNQEGLDVTISVPIPNLQVLPTPANTLGFSLPNGIARVIAVVQYGSLKGGVNQFFLDVGTGTSVYVPAKWARVLVAVQAEGGAGGTVAVNARIARANPVMYLPSTVIVQTQVNAATPSVALGIPPHARALYASGLDNATLVPDSFNLGFTLGGTAGRTRSLDFSVSSLEQTQPIPIGPYNFMGVFRRSVTAQTNIDLVFEIAP